MKTFNFKRIALGSLLPVLGAAVIGLSSLVTPTVASGYENCTDKAQAEWKSKEDAIKAAEDAGYQVRKIKVEGSCYEVYGVGKNGELMELFFHPISMELVHTKKKG